MNINVFPVPVLDIPNKSLSNKTIGKHIFYISDSFYIPSLSIHFIMN